MPAASSLETWLWRAALGAGLPLFVLKVPDLLINQATFRGKGAITLSVTCVAARLVKWWRDRQSARLDASARGTGQPEHGRRDSMLMIAATLAVLAAWAKIVQRRQNDRSFGNIVSAGVAVLSSPTIANAASSVIRRVLNLEEIESVDGDDDFDAPAVLAILLGLLLDHAWASAVILLMVTGGEALEERAMDRAGTALQTLLEQSPPDAVLDNGRVIDAENLVKGDVVIVRPNEVVPADGVLSSDAPAEMDERLLTGETITHKRTKGDPILAGSVNRGDAIIRMVASGPHSASVLHQMRSSLSAALEKKSKVELQSKRLADGLTPVTILTAITGYLISTKLRGADARTGWEVVLSVLMSATPCPAAIGVPVAMLSGMSVSSRSLGATIKSGDALEAMADAKAIVFDKTGTLTFGKPSVASINFFVGEESEASLLAKLAPVEKCVKHVLADAIVRCYAGKSKEANEETFEVRGDVRFDPSGAGVGAVVASVQRPDAQWSVNIGTRAYCGLEDATAAQKSSIYLSSYFVLRKDDRIVTSGEISFLDDIRPEAAALVSRLREQGLRVAVLSGDASAHLEHVAQALQVDEFSHCFPHEKVERVRALQAKYGKVIMVGDGANDSAALAAADVGISVDPSSLSSESADVVILSEGDLRRVYHLIQLSRRVVSIARRTVTVGSTISFTQMVLAASGWTSPFFNAALQEIVDSAAVVHALTALREKGEDENEII